MMSWNRDLVRYNWNCRRLSRVMEMSQLCSAESRAFLQGSWFTKVKAPNLTSYCEILYLHT
jgi:hypothetical protein